MLITGKAANCRRVETQSGGSPDLAVDNGCQHLALEPAKRRRPAHMEVFVQGTRWLCDAEVDREGLEHARNDPTVLTPDPPKEEPSDPSGSIWRDGQNVRHSLPLPECLGGNRDDLTGQHV